MVPLSSSQEDCSMLRLLSSSRAIDAPISLRFVKNEETSKYISSPASCSSQTKESARNRVQRTVDFKSRVRVRAHLNRFSYSEEELESAFMTPREIRRTKAQMLATVKKINNGSLKDDDEEDCKLGLERYTSCNRAVRDKLRFGALQSVLLEQQTELLQQASSSSSSSRSILKKALDSSAERIAQVYKEYSHQSQIYAQVRALENTEEVLLEIDQRKDTHEETTTMDKVSLGNSSSFANLEQ